MYVSGVASLSTRLPQCRFRRSRRQVMLARRPLLLVRTRAGSLRAAWSQIVIAWRLCSDAAAWAKSMAQTISSSANASR